MISLRNFYHRHTILTLWLAMAAIVIVGLFAVTVLIHRVNKEHDDTEASIQRQICTESEVFTNALIDLGEPSKTPAEHERRQANLDAFERTVETGLGGHCDLHLHPAH